MDVVEAKPTSLGVILDSFRFERSVVLAKLGLKLSVIVCSQHLVSALLKGLWLFSRVSRRQLHWTFEQQLCEGGA